MCGSSNNFSSSKLQSLCSRCVIDLCNSLNYSNPPPTDFCARCQSSEPYSDPVLDYMLNEMISKIRTLEGKHATVWLLFMSSQIG